MWATRANKLVVVATCLIGVFAFWMALTLWSNASAHDQGWIWDFPSVTPKQANIDSSYEWEMIGAGNDYTFNTDLTVNYCSFPCTANIYHEDVYLPAETWAAAVDSYSDGVLCADGYCNETDHKSNLAYVKWNTAKSISDDFAKLIARHEPGHTFGLHELFDCSTSSVMSGGCSVTELTSHDVSDINAKY